MSEKSSGWTKLTPGKTANQPEVSACPGSQCPTVAAATRAKVSATRKDAGKHKRATAAASGPVIGKVKASRVSLSLNGSFHSYRTFGFLPPPASSPDA
jgi:hypothetical protein